MKKEINKKIIVLTLVLLAIVIVSFVLISAADAPPTGVTPQSEVSSDSSFFQRWVQGIITDRDARIFIWFITSIVLFLILYSVMDSAGLAFFISIPGGFILSTFVTPASVVGIIRSYDTLPLVFLTFLPLGILFMITYVATVKGKRTLMTTQWLLWCIYFVYIGMKIIAFTGLYSEDEMSKLSWVAWLISCIPHYIGSWIFPTYVLQTFIQNVPEVGSQAFVYYWFSISISFFVAFFMSIWNGWFMNFAMRRTLGIDKAIWKKKMQHVSMGLDTLENLGSRMEGEKAPKS